ncbi:carbohydrate ABC transporter permease [Microbacterium sp. A84]|uniref:carbohydrate ABC transporter permease n=1 Tax=Microbacterium sp. A84 TaxID=3450715 RepID=UPI003F42B233
MTMTETVPATTVAMPAAVEQGGRKRTKLLRKLFPYLLIGPALLYLCVVMIYPLIQGILLSFTDTKLINPTGGRPVELANYEFLFQNDRFWNSVLATLIYTAATVVFAVGLGVITALLLNRAFIGRTLVRGLLTVPWAVPTVAAALIFAWMMNRENGVLNDVTGVLGLGEHGWLTDPKLGMISVIIATVWKISPLVMLIVLASLQSIPGELYEAASLDGANARQQLVNITLPSIAPTIRMMALLMTVWSIRRFEIIYLLTGGGPQDTTTTMVVNVFLTAFHDQQLGRAAAIGVVGLVLSLIITSVYFIAERRLDRKDSL